MTIEYVNLYRIEKHSVQLPFGKSYVDVWSNIEPHETYEPNAGIVTPENAFIQKESWPVIKLSKNDRILNTVPPQYNRLDTYVAIQPELMEVMDSLFDNERNELKYKISKLQSEIDGYELAFKEYSSYPWYKRMWLALFNKRQ